MTKLESPQATTAYQKRAMAQLMAWADGHSFHNREDNECCPDFSCCNPDMFEKDQEKRRERLMKYQIQIGVIQ